MKSKRKVAAKSFKATLERMPSRFNLVVIRIPFDVSKVWGTGGTVRVKGEINGFAFRGGLFPSSEGYHCLLVTKRMRTGGNTALGETAQFRLEADTAKPVAIVPAEFQRVLNEDRAFRRWFEQLGLSMRKWICDWIVSVKSPEARVRPPNELPNSLWPPWKPSSTCPPF